jgi:hypothetical protein
MIFKKKKENILVNVEAKQLQIDLNESGGSKKLDAVKRCVTLLIRLRMTNISKNKA